MATRRQIAAPASPYDGGPVGFAPIRELDRARLVQTVIGDGGERVPMGSTGTVVAIYANGEAFEVEFTQPIDALATVEARAVLLVERADA